MLKYEHVCRDTARRSSVTADTCLIYASMLQRHTRAQNCICQISVGVSGQNVHVCNKNVCNL